MSEPENSSLLDRIGALCQYNEELERQIRALQEEMASEEKPPVENPSPDLLQQVTRLEQEVGQLKSDLTQDLPKTLSLWEQKIVLAMKNHLQETMRQARKPDASSKSVSDRLKDL